MLDMWVLICEKYLPADSYEIYFTAEENGCGLFASNDPDIIGKYNFDVWENEDILGESCWEISEEELKKVLQRILKIDTDNIEELIEAFQDSKYKYDANIYKYEEADISDFG